MNPLRWLLAPLAPLYGTVVRLRNRSFDRHPGRAARVPLPVVSVGNLSTGGTGKTPVTLHLAEALGAAGLRADIVSRGYGGRRPVDPMTVQPDSDPSQTGDEPLMMARRLGPDRVVVGRRRHAAALRAMGLAPAPDLLLLDDGFQHRALGRDVDLLLLDGVRRWGNGRMLPLGDLREPMASAGRASCLVVTRAARADRAAILAWWACWGSGGPVFWVDFAIGALRRFDGPGRLELPVQEVPKPLFAFCALGHPEAFFADLLLAGLTWHGTWSFRDHQPLTLDLLRRVEAAARDVEAAALVCTEKDAVKLAPGLPLTLPLWVAEQQVSGAEPLVAWLRERLGRPGVPPAPASAPPRG